MGPSFWGIFPTNHFCFQFFLNFIYQITFSTHSIWVWKKENTPKFPFSSFFHFQMNEFVIYMVIYQVNWRPVFWGLALQFYFALAILRWDPGYRAFRWLGDRVSEFLAYTDEGSKFVFGDGYEEHFFAFKVRHYWRLLTLHSILQSIVATTIDIKPTLKKKLF